MRLHAIAVALVGASALAATASCGESLPVTQDAIDASTDEASLIDATSDDAGEGGGGDAGCADAAAPCNVTEVATATPRAIAAGVAATIWLEGEIVYALNPTGAPIPIMSSISGGAATGFLAIHSTTALMTQGSGVNRCNTDMPCLADGGPPIGAPMFDLGDTGPVATDGADIFAAERAEPRRLATCGLTQSCGDDFQVVTYLPAAATRLTLTTGHVVLGFTDRTLRAYPRSLREDGGVAAPPALATVDDLRGLASDGPDIYWTDGLAGTIATCAVATCTTSTKVLLTGRAFPRSIAVSNGKAYWLETDADSVVRCTLPACTDATILAKVPRPKDLGVGNRIYVTSETMQRIYAIDP